MKHKTLLLLFLLSTTIMLFGQDSTMIKETCEMIHGLKNKDDIDSQSKIFSKQMQTFFLSSSTFNEGESTKQAVFRFGYKFIRELNRNCQECIIPITISKTYLTDIESKFNKNEVDSLEQILRTVSREKNIYIQIITIDDYYPYNSIEDFAKKYRAVWVENTTFKNGTILIAVSFTKRQIRISTSESAMNLLTDEECTETNDIITPYFKQGKCFEGLIEGVKNIRRKI
jgi:hypothetical protein